MGRSTPFANGRLSLGRLAFALSFAIGASGAISGAEWPEYLGGPSRACYSALDQITVGNVSGLRVAWEFRSGDPGQMQCNPIIVDGVLFGATATNHVFALDAARKRCERSGGAELSALHSTEFDLFGAVPFSKHNCADIRR